MNDYTAVSIVRASVCKLHIADICNTITALIMQSHHSSFEKRTAL